MHPYPSPVADSAATINIKQIDRIQMATQLARIAPPRIKSVLMQRLAGEREVELPDHPDSVADRERATAEAQEITARYYLIHGTDFEISDADREAMERIRSDQAAVLGKPVEIENEKLFYLENIFTHDYIQLGQLIRAIHELSMVRREFASGYARLFRDREKWAEYIRLCEWANEFSADEGAAGVAV